MKGKEAGNMHRRWKVSTNPIAPFSWIPLTARRRFSLQALLTKQLPGAALILIFTIRSIFIVLVLDW
jgi:hypothetical protein